MKANRPVDFSGQSRKYFCIIQTIYFNQKKPFGILKKRFDVLLKRIRAFKVNDETFFRPFYKYMEQQAECSKLVK